MKLAAAILLILGATGPAALAGISLVDTVDLSANVGHAPEPQSVAVNRVTLLYYVADSAESGGVHVYTVGGNVFVDFVALSDPATAIAVNSVTNKVYVGVGGPTPRVEVLDGENLSSIGSISMPAEPSEIAIDETRNRVYAVTPVNPALHFINGEYDYEESGLSYGYEFSGVAVDPVTNKIFVASEGDLAFGTIDGDTMGGGFLVGANPYFKLAADPERSKVWSTLRAPNAVTQDDAGNIANGSSYSTPGAPYGIVLDIASNRAYVTLDTDQVVEIDGETQQVGSPVPSGNDPRGIARSDATGLLYVCNHGSGTVGVYQTPVAGQLLSHVQTLNFSGNLGRVPRPEAVAVDPVTNRVYVADNDMFGGSGGIVVFNGDDNSFDSFVDFGAPATAVAVNPATEKLYAGMGGNDPALRILSTADGSWLNTLYLSAAPVSIAIDGPAEKVYVVMENSGDLLVVDGFWDSEITTLSFTDLLSGVAVNSVTQRIYTASESDSTIREIEADTWNSGSLSGFRDYFRLAVDEQRNKVWSTNRLSNLVSWNDPWDFFGGTAFPMPWAPHSVALNETENDAFVTLEDGGKLVQLDADLGTIRASYNVGAMPRGVAHNPANQRVYVCNFGSGTIDVFALGGSLEVLPQIESVGVNPYTVDPGGDIVTTYVQTSGNVTEVWANAVQFDANGPDNWKGDVPTDPLADYGPHTFPITARDPLGNEATGQGFYYVARTLGVPIRNLADPALELFLFTRVMKTWGIVTQVQSSGSFVISDGEGRNVSVYCPGHGITQTGHFVVVRGQYYGYPNNPQISATPNKLIVVN